MSTTETVEPFTEPDETGEHHTSDLLYVQVAIILAVITAAEVATYFLDLGSWLLPVILTMMVVKFAMVVMFFMHLRFDNKLLSWVFVAGLALAVAVYVATITTFEYWQSL